MEVPPRRRVDARRNDQAILQAARAVFLRDPAAPVSAVAAAAGVGIGGLYRRYHGKEELLRTVCCDALRRAIAIGEAALADADDPWRGFVDYLRGIVESGVLQLTAHLAGSFTITPEVAELSRQAVAVGERVFRLARGSGVLRPDVHLADLTLIGEQLAAVELGDPARTEELRHRYLAIMLDGLRADGATGRLPGPPPSAEELAARWRG